MTATTIPIWREGILYVDKKPLYIVRHTDFPGGESAVGVYGISAQDYKQSKGKVIHKDWHTVTTRPPFKKGSSLLADKALNFFKPEVHKVEKPAIFTARVINGVGTWDGKRGKGFNEYMPDRLDRQNNRWLQGEPTGVFITLDSIKWQDVTQYDSDALLNLLVEKEKGNESIYRLDGAR